MADTRSITLLLDQDLDDELTALSESTGRDKASLAREALIEWLEDQEDIRDALKVIAEGNPTIPLEEVKRLLELEN